MNLQVKTKLYFGTKKITFHYLFHIFYNYFVIT